jgi:hypothetical protein
MSGPGDALIKVLASGAKATDELAPEVAWDLRTVASRRADRDRVGDRLHDVKSAVHRIDTVRALLESGYRFDDARAAKYIESFAAACRTISAELALLERVYATPEGDEPATGRP